MKQLLFAVVILCAASMPSFAQCGKLVLNPDNGQLTCSGVQKFGNFVAHSDTSVDHLVITHNLGLTISPFNVPVVCTNGTGANVAITQAEYATNTATVHFSSTANVTCSTSVGQPGAAGQNGAEGIAGATGPKGDTGSFPTVQSNTSTPQTPNPGQTAFWPTGVLNALSDAGVKSHTVVSADCNAGSHVSGTSDDGSLNCTPDTGAAPHVTTLLKGDGNGGTVDAGVDASAIPNIGQNVVALGADPTGVNDSLAAFQLAASKSQTIYFPPGTYEISAPWRWNAAPGSQLIGGGGSQMTGTLNGNPAVKIRVNSSLSSFTVAATPNGAAESGNTATFQSNSTNALPSGFEIGASVTVTGVSVSGFNTGGSNPPQYTIINIPNPASCPIAGQPCIQVYDPTSPLTASGNGTVTLSNSLAQPMKTLTLCSATPCSDTQVYVPTTGGGLANGTHTVTYTYYDLDQQHETAIGQPFSVTLAGGTSTQQMVVTSPDWDGRPRMWKAYIDGKYQGAGGSGASGQYCSNFASTYAPPCWVGDALVVSTIAGSGTTTGAITAISETNNTVTATVANGFSVGQQVVVTGVTNALYNGTYVVSSATSTSFTYLSNKVSLGASSGGTVSNYVAPTADSIPNYIVLLEIRPTTGNLLAGNDNGPIISGINFNGVAGAGGGIHNINVSRTTLHDSSLTGFTRVGAVAFWTSGIGENVAGITRSYADQVRMYNTTTAAWKGVLIQPPGAMMMSNNDHYTPSGSVPPTFDSGTYGCPASGVGPGSANPYIDAIPTAIEQMGNSGSQIAASHVDLGSLACTIGLLNEGNINYGNSGKVSYFGRIEAGYGSSGPIFSDAIYLDGGQASRVDLTCDVTGFATCVKMSASTKDNIITTAASDSLNNITQVSDAGSNDFITQTGKVGGVAQSAISATNVTAAGTVTAPSFTATSAGTVDLSSAAHTVVNRIVIADQSGACTKNNETVINNNDHTEFFCQSGTWVAMGGGGGGGGTPGGVKNDVQVSDSTSGVTFSGIHNATTQVKYITQSGDGTNANPATFGTVMTQHLGDMQIVRTDNTHLSMGTNCSPTVPCWVGVGNFRKSFQDSATITLVSGSHTPTIYAWVDASGNRQVVYGGIGVTSGDVSCNATCTATFSASPGFPLADTAHTEIGQWTSSVAGSWDASGTQEASVYQSPSTVVAGSFMNVVASPTVFTVGLDTSTLSDPLGTKLGTVSGSFADQDCVKASISGSSMNFVSAGAACGSGTGGGFTGSYLSTTAPQITFGYDTSNKLTQAYTSAGAATWTFLGSAPSLKIIPQIDSTSVVQFLNHTSTTSTLTVDNINAGISVGTAAGTTGNSSNVKIYATGDLNNGSPIQVLVNNSDTGSLAYAGFLGNSGSFSANAGFVVGPILSTFGRVAGVTFIGGTSVDFGFSTGTNANGSMNGPAVVINHTNGGLGLGGLLGLPAAGVSSLLTVAGAPSAVANGTSNHSSGDIGFISTYGNGTAGVNDQWTVKSIPGSGVNPPVALTFSHTGSSGVASVSVPAISTTAYTAVMPVSLIASGACSSAVTVAVTGLATTSVIMWTPNADPTAYGANGLHIWAYPTAGNANFVVCNTSASSLSPSGMTVNFRVMF